MTQPPRGRHDDRVLRVLVVDDQGSFRETMALVFRYSDGIELTAAADSGEQAIRLVEQGLDIDLALIDVNLGGLDGVATADRLHDFDVTTVLTSTYDLSELPVAVSGSSSPYVPKRDIDPTHLVELWERGHQQPGA
mgnify:CR=1 FL=1